MSQEADISPMAVVDLARPTANICYAFDPEKPGEREMLRHLSMLPGTKVSKFMGFTFISVDEPERAVWKYRLISRLEARRKADEQMRAATLGKAF